MSKVKELQDNIEKVQKAIDSPATPEFSKPKLKDKLESLKSQLAEAQKAEESSAKAKDTKPAAKSSKKKTTQKPATKPAEKKAEPKEDEDVIEIQGVKISKKGCPEGYAAFKAFKRKKKASSQKSEAKPEGVKAANSLESLSKHLAKAIPAVKIKKEPKAVKSALKAFNTKMSKAFDELDGILSKTDIARLKKVSVVTEKILDKIPEA